MKKQIIYMAMLLYALSGYGQTTATLITPSGQSQPDNPLQPSTWYQFEPSIAIDKNKWPNLIVAYTCFYYTGQWAQLPGHDDVGTNYNFAGFCYTTGSTPVNESTAISMPNNAQCYGSVSTAFDNVGTGYIMGLNGNLTGFFTAVSANYSDGINWNASVPDNSVYTNGQTQQSGEPVMGIADDYPTSPFVNRYYSAFSSPANVSGNQGNVVNTQYSTDNGTNWNNLIQLSQDYAGAPNIQTGVGGEVYICWANLGAQYTQVPGHIAGTYTTSSIPPSYPAQYLNFAISATDGGGSYVIDSTTYTPIGSQGFGADPDYGNTAVNGNPSMAVDKSCGTNHGMIYIAAALVTSSGGSAIGLWTRPENGTWLNSQFSVISQSGLSHAWMPWVAVDDVTGVVSVVYYGYTGTDQSTTNTYVSYYNPNDPSPVWNSIQVSSGSQTPYPACNDRCGTCDPGADLSNIFPAYYEGNYIGIAAYNNHAYPVWTDRRYQDRYQIWIADIEYNAPQLYSSATTQSICNPLITGITNYAAADQLLVSNCATTVTIASTATVGMTAGQSIIISPGFSTQPGAVFTAEIRSSDCQTPGVQSFSHMPPNIPPSDNSTTVTNVNGINVYAYPNPTSDQITVDITNNNFQNVSFIVTDISGRFLGQYNNPVISGDNITQAIDVSAYANGIYIVTAIADGQKYSFKISKQ